MLHVLPVSYRSSSYGSRYWFRFRHSLVELLESFVATGHVRLVSEIDLVLRESFVLHPVLDLGSGIDVSSCHVRVELKASSFFVVLSPLVDSSESFASELVHPSARVLYALAGLLVGEVRDFSIGAFDRELSRLRAYVDVEARKRTVSSFTLDVFQFGLHLFRSISSVVESDQDSESSSSRKLYRLCEFRMFGSP